MKQEKNGSHKKNIKRYFYMSYLTKIDINEFLNKK